MSPEARTSENSPIRIGWIETADVPVGAEWTGRLGMTFLPGKHDVGVAGVHARDLAADVRRLRDVHGVTTFLLLVEDHELVATSTTGIADAMAAAGIELLRHPIVDGGVPAAAEFRVVTADVAGRLRRGETVVVACRGGLGRTGTTVACLLVEAGVPLDRAIAVTRQRRHGAIENASQEEFVRLWAPRPAAGSAS